MKARTKYIFTEILNELERNSFSRFVLFAAWAPTCVCVFVVYSSFVYLVQVFFHGIRDRRWRGGCCT